MTGLEHEFSKAIEAARAIAAHTDGITYPSMRAAHHVRHTMKQLLYIMDRQADAERAPYMPTMDEVHRFMESNPSTSTEMLLAITKPKAG